MPDFQNLAKIMPNWQRCSQTCICLPRQSLRANVTSYSVLSGLLHNGLIIMHELEGSVRWEQGRAFALIKQGQRQSSNLGFRTLRAEQQRNTFMRKYC